eukprot:Gb_10083 [translate_table: standard]
MTWACGVGTGFPLPTCYKKSNTYTPCIASAILSSPQPPPPQIPSKTTNKCSISSSSTISRRHIFPLMGFSFLFSLSEEAEAKDIPLFGIKKLKKVEEEVAKEVEELVKEGEQEVEKAAGVVKEAAEDLEAAALFEGPEPVVQAGVVAGAEAIGVLIASSVVNSIVGNEPSK